MFECKLCDKSGFRLHGLSTHIRLKHLNEISLKNYYDKYIKNEHEGLCAICKKETIYHNFVQGYLKFCNYCNKRYFRKQSKEYWIYNKKLSLEESKIKANQYQKSIADINSKLIKSDMDKHKKSCHICKEYWIEHGLSEKQAVEKIKIQSKIAATISIKKRLENPDQYPSHYTEKYWINKGITDPYKINEKINNIKKTHKKSLSLNGFISRYGEKEGLLKYQKFCETRSHNLKFYIDRYGEKEGKAKYSHFYNTILNRIHIMPTRGWSKDSQKLFWLLFNQLKTKNYKIYFASLDNGIYNEHTNKEFIVRYEKKRFYRLDFYIEDLNKCIEYDCSYWHNDKVADMKRENTIINTIKEIQILHISDIEFFKNKEQTVKKCIEFLTGGGEYI